MTVNGSLKSIHIFHTDRGNEFKNWLIEEMLETFDITRLLSHKGCPYDNAVAEATFKIIKTEFVKNQTSQQTLSRWQKELRETGDIESRGSGNYASDEAKEIARLKRELRDAQDELEVLKKAIKILGK